MSTAAQIKALGERAIEGLTLPAMIAVSAAYLPDRESAKQECLRKLQADLSGEGVLYGRKTTTAVIMTHPEAETDRDRWEVRQREFAPHEIDPNRILWVPYIHGGHMLQANYYFEWDGA